MPETVSTRGQLLIGNQGNATQSFVVQWSDKEGALNFTPSETHVNVRPESTAEVWYSARPRSLHWIGREKQHQIAVQVIPDGGQPQIKTGTVISRALIPPWLIPILFTLLALAVIVAMTMFKPEFVNAQVEPERTPIAGVPITMSWQAINSCFYSVSVNGTTSEWLQFSPGTAQVTLTEQIPGSIIQVDLRNCFFIAGKPWQVVVADPPTPTATPLPAPQISGFVVNTNLAIVGQSGDICFAWQVAHSNKSLTIQPLIGDMDIQKSEFCTPIATTFVQSQTITFSLIAVNSQDSMTSTTLAAPVTIWSPECKVSGDFLNVREGPGTIFPERGQLKNGQIVRIKAQPYFPFDRITQDGSGEGWIEILAGANDSRPAWVDFGYLDCAPIRDLLNGLPPSAAIPQDPTFTPTPTPTATVTPTPLPPDPQFITNVEPKIINQGGCVIVSWDVQQVKEVYLNGAGKMGTGEFEDCPTEEKKYNWHIRLKDDTFKNIELQVKVNPSATPGSLPPPVSQ